MGQIYGMVPFCMPGLGTKGPAPPPPTPHIVGLAPGARHHPLPITPFASGIWDFPVQSYVISLREHLCQVRCPSGSRKKASHALFSPYLCVHVLEYVRTKPEDITYHADLACGSVSRPWNFFFSLVSWGCLLVPPDPWI